MKLLKRVSQMYRKEFLEISAGVFEGILRITSGGITAKKLKKTFEKYLKEHLNESPELFLEEIFGGTPADIPGRIASRILRGILPQIPAIFSTGTNFKRNFWSNL